MVFDVKAKNKEKQNNSRDKLKRQRDKGAA
jgi:hypothetical protein